MANEFTGTSDRTKALIAAMLARAGQPNPSLGGAIGHGLAAGILGLVEGQDRRDNAAAMDKVISLYSPDAPSTSAPTSGTAPMPSVPPVAPPRTEAPAVSKEMLADSLTDKPTDLSGGFLPKDKIDRSGLAFLSQPGPRQDIFVQNMGGEGGFKSPENDRMLAESTGNRILKMAAAKGVTPEQYFDKDMLPARRGGYFDSRTAPLGADALRTNQQGADRFRRQTLVDMLGGSDYATQALGFTPDGNASGTFADKRAANGVYRQFAKAPSGETFVNQFKGDVPRTYGLSSVMGPPVGAPPLQPPQTASLPPAGMVPQAGLTEGARVTNVPTRPVEPNMQTAQAQPPQATQAPRPSVPTLPSDPTTQRLMDAYRNASPRDRERLGPMVLQQLQTARQQQLELQKQIFLENYKRENPNYTEKYGTFADRNKNPLAYQERSGTLAAENDVAPATAARKGLEKQAETEGELRGKIRAGLPQSQATLEQAIRDAEGLRKHPGRESSMGDIMGNVPDWMIRSNTAAKDFITRLNQVKGESFLKAYETLKGGGSITEVEGTKATAAINRMNRATTQGEFESALNDYQDSVRTGLAKLREVAGESPRQQGQPMQGGAKGFDYNSVRPGEKYTAPDGTTRTKR